MPEYVVWTVDPAAAGPHVKRVRADNPEDAWRMVKGWETRISGVLKAALVQDEDRPWLWRSSACGDDGVYDISYFQGMSQLIDDLISVMMDC